MPTVQSIERAFEILEALAREPAGVTDLAAATHLPKSTVARLLATLEVRGAVEKTDEHSRYRLGQVIADLAAAVAPGRNLIGVAQPHLADITLQIGEASGLSVPHGFDVHYIDQVESPNPVQVRDWTGELIPMHVVPSGLVMLAHTSPAEVEEYVSQEVLAKPTRKTVADPEGIRAKLAAARASGHVWVFEEFAKGINSVAAPIRDQSGGVIAALHVHGPAYRFPAQGADHFAALVIEAADRVSKQLGYRP